ncbi:MAG: hypothetical protein AAGI91_16450 [Bacteroidota bacterium]
MLGAHGAVAGFDAGRKLGVGGEADRPAHVAEPDRRREPEADAALRVEGEPVVVVRSLLIESGENEVAVGREGHLRRVRHAERAYGGGQAGEKAQRVARPASEGAARADDECAVAVCGDSDSDDAALRLSEFDKPRGPVRVEGLVEHESERVRRLGIRFALRRRRGHELGAGCLEAPREGFVHRLAVEARKRSESCLERRSGWQRLRRLEYERLRTLPPQRTLHRRGEGERARAEVGCIAERDHRTAERDRNGLTGSHVRRRSVGRRAQHTQRPVERRDERPLARFDVERDLFDTEIAGFLRAPARAEGEESEADEQARGN